ncbi:hypothetical protein BTVI_30725 [Pitangus sulphuratus]|nr:hypothetical protein BTVI_30725 [Pitangus sulphuratus]
MPFRRAWTSSRSGPMGIINFKKCKVLHLGQGKPQYQYMLGDKQIESHLVEKDLGVLVDETLDMTQQRTLTIWKASHVPRCTKSSMGSKWREVILPLYSALVRPHLEWGPALGSPA